MDYATLTDLEMRLGPAAYLQLTDDEHTGSPNAGRAGEALAAAQAEVDSRLAVRHETPVEVSGEPQAAALLRSLVLDLAEHRLHARRPPVPEAIRDKAHVARRWLRDLAAGGAQLPVARGVADPSAAGVIAETAGAQRVFRRDDTTACEDA